MRKLTKNMSLLQKMVAIILTVVIVPILIIGIITTNISKTALENQSENSKAAIASQTASMIDQEMERINQMFLQVSTGTAFQEVVKNLEPRKGLSGKEMAEWNLSRMKYLQVLDKDIQSITISNKYITSMSLMYVTGDIVGPARKLPEKTDDVRETKVYQKLINSNDMVWLNKAEADMSVDSPYLTVGKSVRSFYYSDSEPVAVIMIELNYGAFQSMLSKIKIGENDMSYLIATNGSLISSLSYEETVQMENEPVFAEVAARAAETAADTFTMNVNGVSSIVTYNKCDISGLIYMIVIPKAEVFQGSDKIRNSIFLVGLIFSVIAVCGGLYFSLNMAKDLKDVEKIMFVSAKGDLTVTARTKRTDEIGKVADSFNSMVKSIRTLLIQSKEVSREVSETAESLSRISDSSSCTAKEISDAINDVANGAGQQSEEVDMSVRTFQGLAEEIKNAVISTNVMVSEARNVKNYTAQGIQTAKTLDGKALEVISITAEVVEQISGLAQSITIISEFTKILNEISEQTKLLSLNASIEAARAGEYGKGFTVVAEEIRKLAEQSGGQTTKIETLVRQLMLQTKDSTEFVMKAKDVIKEQAESAKDSAEYFGKIDTAVTELLQNINRINGAIHKIDQDKDSVLNSINNIAAVSEVAAASSEEVSASTQEQLNTLEELTKMAVRLNDYSKNLEETLKHFKV
ncbi:methyl-accepting chemotaxis sensory transducer with Cache sensor [Mobilisporobacter senegalensis]|uniref:Methyl-accepting chemotaxis sensory transducer with Cache sensor n=1 Tax=Mobilisporobacter senegalensis TaxID=1329262 RepID=A0A3N1XV12_9FIRM|nr:methyl-accepting chemotaxis protein [Mobilisporobacter senegalensis]ROR30453.1 methyl-accepting chemotaxis sensory transducer with Cache sensor [Mobilisporobacter senegalensis]